MLRLGEYYQGTIPLKGAIIYGENRDTLEHSACEVHTDPEALGDLLARVKAMLSALDAGRLPVDTPPPEHRAHAHCPYLDSSGPGPRAVEWQATPPRALLEKVLADIITKRILAKTRKGDREKEGGHAHTGGPGSGPALGRVAEQAEMGTPLRLATGSMARPVARSGRRRVKCAARKRFAQLF